MTNKIGCVQHDCDACKEREATLQKLKRQLAGMDELVKVLQDERDESLTAPILELVEQARDALAKFAAFGAVGTRDVDVAQAQAAIANLDAWMEALK